MLYYNLLKGKTSPAGLVDDSSMDIGVPC